MQSRNPRGRKKQRPEAEHPVAIVAALMRLIDPAEKDYLITEKADLSRSYLSGLRHDHTRDPRISKIVKIADALGYEVVLLKREKRK